MEQSQLPLPVVETPPISGVEDSQVVGVNARRDTDVAERDHSSSCVTLLKRKRGRPAKGVHKPTPPPPLRRKKDEEDVCFICFDGGSLVLCDRRSCPKAYHPACIKRDEAFFRSKAKWVCGWHICSHCEKASHYMCYTCTYSLCKGCTKDADFVCVRENKGLCGICMKTIKLIESSARGNKEVEVDFDDTSSWEYLFKVYWMYLKGKLSLTFDEILQAKNPWKASVCKVQNRREFYHLKVEIGSHSEKSFIKIVIDSNNLLNKKFKIGEKDGHIWDVVLNDDEGNTEDSSADSKPSGNICVTKKNAGVAKLEASGVSANISSLLHSTEMEQPISDILNHKSWHYEDQTATRVHGPFSMLQLCQWNAYRYFPSNLRIWRIGEKEDASMLLTDILTGKCSLKVSLSHNREQLSLGAGVTLKENSHDGMNNATRSEICANNHIIEQHSLEQKVDNMELDNNDGLGNETRIERYVDSKDGLNNATNIERCVNNQIVVQRIEQKMVDKCLESYDKDESVKSSGEHSQSSCSTVQANGNDESKCEISHHIGPQIYPEKLNENPSDKPNEGYGNEGNSRVNGNFGSKLSEGRSGQSDQKQSDNEENSRQSSSQNSRVPEPGEILPPCNATSWLASIFGESGDPFGDESVSDLLAEVEAMESLGGMESPTSMMKCGEELTDGSIAECLGFANSFSSILDVGKGDALSSTSDLHLGSQSTTPEEPFQQVENSQGFANGFSLMLAKGDDVSSTSDLHLRSQSTTPEEPFPEADNHHHQTIHSSKTSEVESTFSRIKWN